MNEDDKKEYKFVILHSGLVVPNPTEYAKMNKLITKENSYLEMLAKGYDPDLENYLYELKVQQEFNKIFKKEFSMIKTLALSLLLISLLILATIVIR